MGGDRRRRRQHAGGGRVQIRTVKDGQLAIEIDEQDRFFPCGVKGQHLEQRLLKCIRAAATELAGSGAAAVIVRSPAAVLWTEAAKSVGDTSCPSAKRVMICRVRPSSPWRLQKTRASTGADARAAACSCRSARAASTARREPALMRRAVIMGMCGVLGRVPPVAGAAGASVDAPECAAQSAHASRVSRPGARASQPDKTSVKELA